MSLHLTKCCGRWASIYPRITASGHVIRPGDAFVAAPKNIPFGTTLIVPGYNNGKPVKVLDRGGAIKGNRLDAYFPSHQEALNFGVK
ncbi:MAG: 3D domain-containing protein, partial [Sedimentisphaerales bacterium]|nr:3D domain-containing protein [Sedimentisphaerales bacterium]